MPNTRELELWKLVNAAFQNSMKKFGDIFAKDVTRDLLANGVTIQKWIPVTERLPEKKGNYLGFTGSTFMVGYYKGNGIWWIWLDDREGENLFTHWMPLPPAPEGD